jgi:hypothetical protein
LDELVRQSDWHFYLIPPFVMLLFGGRRNQVLTRAIVFGGLAIAWAATVYVYIAVYHPYHPALGYSAIFNVFYAGFAVAAIAAIAVARATLLRESA